MDWFRMYAEFAHDPKVQRMSEAYQRRFVMLMCLRCNGYSNGYSNGDVTFALRINETEWQETKAEFIRLNLIDTDNNLMNWDKRQKRSDSSAERVRAFRERKKEKDETNGNVTVTAQIRGDKIRKEKNKDSTAFALPDWIDKTDWADYEEMRRKKRKPLTDRARKLAITELEKLCKEGWKQKDVFEHTILKTYDTFYPPARGNQPVAKPANQSKQQENLAIALEAIGGV